MRKRGVSNVVGIILIVAFLCVSVILVWMFVASYLDGSMFEEKPDIRVVSSEGYTVYDEKTHLASVQIERGDDDFDVSEIGVYFVAGRESVKFVIDEENQGVLESGSVKTYKFNLDGYGRPKMVRVSGVYK